MCRLNKRLPAIIARLLNSLLFWFWKRHFTLWVSVGWCAARSCAAKVFPSTWMLPSHTPEDRFSAKSRSDSHKLTTRAVDICFNSQGLAFWMWSAFWRKAKFISKVSACQRVTAATQFNVDVQIWKLGCASLGPHTRAIVVFYMNAALFRSPSGYLANTCRRSCTQNQDLQPTDALTQCLGIHREFRKCSKKKPHLILSTVLQFTLPAVFSPTWQRTHTNWGGVAMVKWPAWLFWDEPEQERTSESCLETH